MALAKQLINLPLGLGQDQKNDEFTLEPPKLEEAKNVEFERPGSLRTRKTYSAILDDAGNTMGAVRRLAVLDDELIAFTETKVWSYSSENGIWTEKDDWLAVKVEEHSRFTNKAQQSSCDRAEVDGVVAYCWSEEFPGVTMKTYLAFMDKATSAVLAVNEITTSTKPRVYPVDTKILFTYVDGSNVLRFRFYDTDDVSSYTTYNNPGSTFHYDLCPGSTSTQVTYAYTATGGASYYIREVNTAGTGIGSEVNHVLAGDVISIDRDGADQIHVARYTGAAAVKGDILNSSFTALYSSVSICIPGITGGDIQVTVSCLPTAIGGQYTSYIAGSDAGATIPDVFINSFDDTGTAGTASQLGNLGLASHAFPHTDDDGNEDIYLWVTFAESSVSTTSGFYTADQNTYFLVRCSDARLVAKACHHFSGGYPPKGELPGVQALGGKVYGFCGTERRIVPTSVNQQGYTANSPREVVFEFDSNESRRTCRLGRTLYVSGGFVAQYDGSSLVELGFPIYPWFLSVAAVGSGANMDTGDYYFKATYSYENAKGELERSTTSATEKGTLTATTQRFRTSTPRAFTTLKTGRLQPAVEYWRTTVNPTVNTPFYLTNSVDPSTNPINNPFEPSKIGATFEDDYYDALPDYYASGDHLIERQSFYENGGVLPNICPPPGTILISTQDRLFLSGVSGNPDRVMYSKIRSPGELAAFSDALYIDLPPDGGKITALAFLNETLVAFKESAVYALNGDGFDNVGGGQNYGPARLLASDVGAVSHETVALTPRGLIFLSSKGWYLLTSGWQLNYIGGPVSDYDSDSFQSVHVLESQHQVRCCSTSRVLVWDYLIDQWSEWTISDLTHSVIWNGEHTYSSSTAGVVKQQNTDWSGTEEASLDIETPWIKLNGLQGYQRIRKFSILGQYKSACDVRIRVAYDYEQTDSAGVTWTDDIVNTSYASGRTAGEALQIRQGPSRQKCQAIKIRIQAYDSGNSSPYYTSGGESFTLSGLALEVGVKRGIYRGTLQTQKQ